MNGFWTILNLKIMPYIKIIARVKVGELPTFGATVTNSLALDYEDFTNFSPKYDAAYLAKIQMDKKDIEALINPVQLIGELKIITRRIYTNQNQVSNEMNYLEGYVSLTKNLKVGAADFGFHAVRVANNSGDIEGVVSGLKLVTKIAGDNIILLTASGFTPAKLAALVALMNNLDVDNVSQTGKLNERKRLVETNHVVINDYWNELVSICKIGKIIQKPVSQAKMDEYIISTVTARLRNDAKKTKISGAIPKGSKIEFKPLLNGRKRVVYAKPDCTYEITGIEPNEYMANLIVNGLVTASKNLVVESGNPLVENFGMVR